MCIQVSNMSSLVRLDVSDNRLSALPRLLAAKLSKLQEINLSHNSFLHIPSVLKNLHQLRVIDLSDNEDLQVCSKHPLAFSKFTQTQVTKVSGVFYPCHHQ